MQSHASVSWYYTVISITLLINPTSAFLNIILLSTVLEKLREFSKGKGVSSSHDDANEVHEWKSAKGSIISTAVIAGVMAAKKTPDLIPLCHPIPLEGCDIDIQLVDEVSLKLKTRLLRN